jgi:putative transposase
MSRPERKQQIAPNHPMSVKRQCELLSISRSNAYYQPAEMSEAQRTIMRKLDELHLKVPFYGARRLRDALLDEHGLVVNRKRVQRLMKIMQMRAVYPGSKKKTSLPNKAHRIYPYLLADLPITRSNQVWCTDITYVPMAKGFGYLIAIMDWHSRKVLSWRLSNVLETDFCVEALEEAISRYGSPEIFNTDQGSQFTSEAFTDVLKDNAIQISMDGKGRWIDNVFIERLWRSVKYEEIYLHAYQDLDEGRARLKQYFEFYNTRRRHQTLGCYPDERYYEDLVPLKIAI